MCPSMLCPRVNLPSVPCRTGISALLVTGLFVPPRSAHHLRPSPRRSPHAQFLRSGTTTAPACRHGAQQMCDRNLKEGNGCVLLFYKISGFFAVSGVSSKRVHNMALHRFVAMEGQIFRAMWLALLMNSVLPSVASETNHLTPEADFTATIPKSGLERNVEKVFSLGPSDRLQVIDETASAVYLPQKSGSNEDNSSGQYGTAYLFLNGTCDFDKTIQLKDAFPGYPKPLWVREEPSSSGNDEEASSKRSVRYIFTNPPEEYLGEVTSFCVRFKTVQASGSNTETSTTAPTTSATSSGAQAGGTTIPGNGDVTAKPENPEQNPEGSGTPSPPLNDSIGSGGEDVPGPGATVGGDQDEEGKDDKLESPAAIPPVAGDGAEGPESHPEQGLPNENDNANLPPSPTGDNGESEAQKKADAQGGGDQLGSARLRRLSVTPEAEEAFLTIVVHSSTWCVAGGISALSFLLSAAVAILLQVF